MSAKGTPSGPNLLMTDLAVGEWAALARYAADVLTAGTDVSRLRINNGGGAA